MHRYPPLTDFEHYDHGKDADPGFPDLLPTGKAEIDDLTPTIGSEVKGVQLSQLTDKGKDQLALFVAQRKVVGTLPPPLYSTKPTNPTSLPRPGLRPPAHRQGPRMGRLLRQTPHPPDVRRAQGLPGDSSGAPRRRRHQRPGFPGHPHQLDHLALGRDVREAAARHDVSVSAGWTVERGGYAVL